MEQKGYANEGSLKISEEVISTIAATAADEIKGVAGLSTRPNSDFKGILRTGKKPGKAIRITIREGEALIDVYVNLFMGVKIPDAAGEIQTRVKDAVQTMTGITVAKVNVHVSGIVFERDSIAAD